jgi:hypothetical protein
VGDIEFPTVEVPVPYDVPDVELPMPVDVLPVDILPIDVLPTPGDEIPDPAEK